jgi:hypothetical protein
VFDTGIKGIDARPVATDGEICIVVLTGRQRNQVFGASKDKDVGLLRVPIEWEPLIGLPGDGGLFQTPTETEGAIARTGVIVKRQIRAEPGSTWAKGDRHRN